MTITNIQTQERDIQRIFKLQKTNQQKIAGTSARQRIAKIKKLHKAILRYRQEIREALYRDFRKHPSEVDLTEIYVITAAAKHAVRYLRRWMQARQVDTPMALLGSSSYIHYEPKGVVLIISPWNFPVNLTFGPLISAIAAGNCVMLKPSENTPHASALMAKIVGELFDENEVALIEGAVETSQALLKLPFNHIFFTGSPKIGKLVMEAAAQYLSSVTLELGGKSPTIIDETADVKTAARRLSWAKFLNNGQICIAPDYVFVHESKKEAFLQQVQKSLREFYGESQGDKKSSQDYCRMVNQNHYERVKKAMEEALQKGATPAAGGHFDDDQHYIEPTLVTGVDMNSSLMQEEIFGPVLPVLGFHDLQEPIDLINEKEKPLALYIFSKSRKNIRRIMQDTRAGGSCINHSGLHFFNNNLPFGGSNHSGIGKGHGRFGFEAFSNARSVYKQVLPGAIDLLTPPYNKFKQKLIDLTIRWF